MTHHTVATMLSGILGACYIAFVIGNVVEGQPIPDGTIFSIVTNAIVALGIKGYYDHLKKAEKAENIDSSKTTE